MLLKLRKFVFLGVSGFTQLFSSPSCLVFWKLLNIPKQFNKRVSPSSTCVDSLLGAPYSEGWTWGSVRTTHLR